MIKTHDENVISIYSKGVNCNKVYSRNVKVFDMSVITGIITQFTISPQTGYYVSPMVLPGTLKEDVIVDWGDGYVEIFNNGTILKDGGRLTHDYPNTEDYTVKLFGSPNVDFSFGYGRDSEMRVPASYLKTVDILQTKGQTDYSYMFYYCNNLTSLPIKAWDTIEVTNMTGMFGGCESLTSIPLFNTSNVLNMQWMFENCISLSAIPKFDTSKVVNMYGSFLFCDSLVSIPELNLSEVSDMTGCFNYCNNLTTIGGFIGLKVGFSLSYSTALTKESLMNVINNLVTVTTDPVLDLSSQSLSLLSTDEKDIATNKGWIVV